MFSRFLKEFSQSLRFLVFLKIINGCKVSTVYKNIYKNVYKNLFKNLAGWILSNSHFIKNLFRLPKKNLGSFMRVYEVYGFMRDRPYDKL